MYVAGSPEWFHEEANTTKRRQFQEQIEMLREQFLVRFSPEKLTEMTAEELLQNVFGDSRDSMMYLLMFDANYRNFGAAGGYKFNGIVYQTDGGSWSYKDRGQSRRISWSEAKEKAVDIRNLLVDAARIISTSELNTINDYEKLDQRLSHIFFYQYAWAMKYYQMVFPYYFPGMYVDGRNQDNSPKTLDRAIEILGLQLAKGNNKRLIKAGEVSLFIRRCDVNNIIFNDVYGAEWGWDKPYSVCPSAAENYAHRDTISVKSYDAYYRIPSEEKERKKNNLEQAKIIEDNLDSLPLKGEDREAVVRVRTNQSEFRDRLLKRYGKCCLCGVSDARFLVASHIKPWVDSEPEEKLDPDNGFLLCPNHDKLFDLGIITFDADGLIILSKQLSEVDQMFMNVNEKMKIELNEQNKKYLEFHREYVFKD